MKILVKAIIGRLRKFAIAAVTGLAGWKLMLANLAGKYIGKYLWKALEAAGKAIGSALAYFDLDRIYEEQKKREEHYEDTLKDGATEKAQDDATSDLLNGRKR